MKIWKGPELEGNRKGVKTLFVKDAEPDCEMIINYLVENPECKRLYLGAGRTDVINLCPVNDLAESEYGLELLLRYCKKRDIEIALEVSVSGIKHIPNILWDNVSQTIVRILDKDLRHLSTADCIKIDDEKDVYVVEVGHMIHTSLKTLNGDTFEEDTVLFDNGRKIE